MVMDGAETSIAYTSPHVFWSLVCVWSIQMKVYVLHNTLCFCVCVRTNQAFAMIETQTTAKVGERGTSMAGLSSVEVKCHRRHTLDELHAHFHSCLINSLSPYALHSSLQAAGTREQEQGKSWSLGMFCVRQGSHGRDTDALAG